jgi:hypothetical protein
MSTFLLSARFECAFTIFLTVPRGYRVCGIAECCVRFAGVRLWGCGRAIVDVCVLRCDGLTCHVQVRPCATISDIALARENMRSRTSLRNAPHSHMNFCTSFRTNRTANRDLQSGDYHKMMLHETPGPALRYCHLNHAFNMRSCCIYTLRPRSSAKGSTKRSPTDETQALFSSNCLAAW